jgi:hypothetical protein
MDLANKARPRKPARRTGSHLASAKTFGDRHADQGRFFDLKVTDLFRTLADSTGGGGRRFRLCGAKPVSA